MSKQRFTTVVVKFRLRVYGGRLRDDILNPRNYLLYIRDMFTKTILRDEQLREGEYIRLIEVEEVDCEEDIPHSDRNDESY